MIATMAQIEPEETLCQVGMVVLAGRGLWTWPDDTLHILERKTSTPSTNNVI
jgi:hypothetical protein